MTLSLESVVPISKCLEPVTIMAETNDQYTMTLADANETTVHCNARLPKHISICICVW